ncbi:16907_t:CDS:2 [Funneliformis geosporum]|uniref:16907_t:CDS:1 n=1 Tax=Funneliformis geosporum TaxID=1117311 RepID=A0A9W4T209_9GLOM|nr:16907_t:CDS:2 [Funneliformis geosporum]
MDKSNKVFCTCSKCCHKDTKRGIGLFIPKSTRTRHRKRDNENLSVVDSISSSSSETASILSLSDVFTSSKSKSSVLVELPGSSFADNMISTSKGEASSSLSDKAENSSIDESYINEILIIQDMDESRKCFDESHIDYESSSSGTSSNRTNGFSDSDVSHTEISDPGEHLYLSDELAFNGGNVSLFQVKQTLQSIVPIEPMWVDICINSCCAYTGKYKYDELCEYCHISRFQTGPSMGK